MQSELTGKTVVGQNPVSRNAAVGLHRLLNTAMTVAGHKDGEAALRVTIALHLRRLRLEPADGPVGVVRVRVRKVPPAIGWNDDHVVLPVDHGVLSAGPAVPALPRPRAAAA